MGAGWSAATGLHVQCDKEEYVAGDTVRAVVALNVVGNPIKLEGIELEVRCSLRWCGIRNASKQPYGTSLTCQVQ